jgi:hypothetical protein
MIGTFELDVEYASYHLDKDAAIEVRTLSHDDGYYIRMLHGDGRIVVFMNEEQGSSLVRQFAAMIERKNA